MYSVIDIGSNSMRLVIYKIEDGKIIPLLNKKNAVGLASYIDKDKRMSETGMIKAEEALLDFQEVLGCMDVEETFPFATASLRNITNTQEVLDYLKKTTGYDISVLSGSEEAVFDYYGAIQSTKMDDGILVDIGGGSTELVLYENKEVVATTSLPIGSLNLFTKYVDHILPTKKEMNEIQNEVKKQLDTVKFPKFDFAVRRICGVGGTARAVFKMLMSKNKSITIDDIEYGSGKLKDLLSAANGDAQKFGRQILRVDADRIHTFIPGLVVLQTIADYYDIDCIITSNYGVREGYLYYILESRGVFNGDQRF